MNETPGHHPRHPHGDPGREHRSSERSQHGTRHEVGQGARAHDRAFAHVAHHKRALRERILACRDRLSTAARRAHSARVFDHLLTLPELKTAESLMCFVSFRSEVDTLPFIGWSLDHGKRVALPRIVGKRHMEAFWVTDPAIDLETGSYGIREPRPGLPQASPKTIDLVVVPGSAFDRSGDRIGYGGGFYDSFLPRLRSETPRIAVAFDLQLVDDVPDEHHDLPIDAVVTERGVLRFARRGEEPTGGRG